MTKRFTPKAADFTKRLADVQARQAKLRRELRALAEEENTLKAFLMPFYNGGLTDVTYGDTIMQVNFDSFDRSVLDQERAKAVLTKNGLKVPMATVTIQQFQVKLV